MTGRIEILAGADELAGEAARRIVEAVRESIAVRGRFCVALAGGSTPERTYKLLASPELAEQIDWARVLIFFGDERFVPADDARSNYCMAKQSLLDHLPIPAEHIFPIDTSTDTVEDAAARYSQLLARELGEPPVFDLVLLGMGDDGHTASLFPHAAALSVADSWAVSSPPGVLPPPVDRVTVTFPVIHAARQVLFLIAGANKAEPVRDVLQGDAAIDDRPSAGAIPSSGDIVWLLDAEAGSLLD